MSREIKFRAWDNRIMYYPKYSDKHSDPIRRLLEFLEDKMSLSNFPEVILMQYTGNKDENEKDVYDGDIIDVKSHGKYLVKWNSEFNCWETELLDKIGTEHFMFNNFFTGEWNSHYIKIIGNIYQNPDILQSAFQESKLK